MTLMSVPIVVVTQNESTALKTIAEFQNRSPGMQYKLKTGTIRIIIADKTVRILARAEILPLEKCPTVAFGWGLTVWCSFCGAISKCVK